MQEINLKHWIIPTKIGSKWVNIFFWYRLIRIVMDKGSLNGLLLTCCCCVVSPSVLWRCWFHSRKAIQSVEIPHQSTRNILLLPSVLWYCWLGVRKSIRPVKTWVTRCLCGYLSGARCKWFAYGWVDATATPPSLTSLKSRLVLPVWCLLTQVVL